jgi:hypothetical protein
MRGGAMHRVLRDAHALRAVFFRVALPSTLNGQIRAARVAGVPFVRLINEAQMAHPDRALDIANHR